MMYMIRIVSRSLDLYTRSFDLDNAFNSGGVLCGGKIPCSRFELNSSAPKHPPPIHGTMESVYLERYYKRQKKRAERWMAFAATFSRIATPLGYFFEALCTTPFNRVAALLRHQVSLHWAPQLCKKRLFHHPPWCLLNLHSIYPWR